MNNSDNNIEISFLRLPSNVSVLSIQPNSDNKISKGLFVFNLDLSHGSLSSNLPADYYDDYLMTNSFSESMQQLQANQASELSKLSASTDRFIEIGCGDGSFLNHCSNYFKNVVAIEPSKVFADEAREKGFKVIETYISHDINNPFEAPFDAFACRQVFEHIENPVDMFKGISNLLKPGSVGLVEVPNGLRSLLESRFFDFFPDHTQYYSATSLVCFAKEAGFTTLSCKESFNRDYLELWVVYNPDFHKYCMNIELIRTNLVIKFSEFIVNQSKNNKSIAIWGVGAKTLSLFPSLSIEINEKIEYAIDSDPHKQEKYIPGTNIKVKPPEILKKSNIDTIIILALSYRQEIKNSIQDLSSKEVEIWTITNDSKLTTEF